MEGVVRTRVGYAGGTTKNPTYHNIGDHSETIQVDYDPSRISYQGLLDIFWNSHNPTDGVWSGQYKNMILCQDDEQKREALESKQQVESRLGQTVVTDILPLTAFYVAEDYHQKFYLRQAPQLMKDLSAIYPDQKDFMNSTAAARLNGYVGGYGSLDTLKEQLNSFGLSETGNQKLLDITGAGLTAVCPVR